MANLPSATRGSADVAKLTIGITSAVLGIFIPGAGVIGPAADYAIERFIKRPEKILVNELKRGNLEILDDEKAAAFVPMAYKFFEAAKEGEYQHNLRILAEFLTNEMKTEIPDPPSFARMARRIEALTRNDLKVVALVHTVLSENSKTPATNGAPPVRHWVSAHSLASNPLNCEGIDRQAIQESLSDLAGRGLLTVDGSNRWNKAEEYYFISSSFRELLEKAGNSLKNSVEGTAASSSVDRSPQPQ